jgi:hypothetical protein
VACVLDRLQRRARLPGTETLGRRAGLHIDRGQGVGDDVVQLARDPHALLLSAPLRLLLARLLGQLESLAQQRHVRATPASARPSAARSARSSGCACGCCSSKRSWSETSPRPPKFAPGASAGALAGALQDVGAADLLAPALGALLLAAYAAAATAAGVIATERRDVD